MKDQDFNRREQFAWMTEGRSYLQVVLDVHMTTTGAMIRPECDQENDKEALRFWLDSWEPPASSKIGTRSFDGIVQFLGKLAILEEQLNAE